MSEPFLAEIRIMGFSFPPQGWALCNGQLLQISQNQALFSLLGTTYGGNGQTTFALPDLRGRIPIHVGNGMTLGERAGEENHTLSIAEMPAHLHSWQAQPGNGNNPVPSNTVLGAYNNGYGASADTTLNAAAITNLGGSQPHLNTQPFLTLSFCIALVGIFPSRN